MPSKVVSFSWQLILDRIPSRHNLLRRGVSLPEGGRGSALYEAPSESSLHLFFECPSVFMVWYEVARWLGWKLVIPLGLAQLLLYFTGLGGGKRVMIGLLLIWHVVI